MIWKNYELLSLALRGTKRFWSASTRNFMARRFLRRAINLGKRAGFWERAALDYDPDLEDHLKNRRG
ncbi:hypothetical protein SAMN05192541_124110 [Bradyrhizobium arachidis]|nr:hypothetical protein SAMN05192541_124110 [Bradyrhizobium arachidis]